MDNLHTSLKSRLDNFIVSTPSSFCQPLNLYLNQGHSKVPKKITHEETIGKECTPKTFKKYVQHILFSLFTLRDQCKLFAFLLTLYMILGLGYISGRQLPLIGTAQEEREEEEYHTETCFSKRIYVFREFFKIFQI